MASETIERAATPIRILRPALRHIPAHRRALFAHDYRWFRDQAGYPTVKAALWALAEARVLDFDPKTMSLTLMDWRGR